MRRISNEKFSFKYIVREIIIVSIGVLIAFGINTLSSNWKKKKVYNEYKASLIADLEQNLESLERISLAQNQKVKDLDEVILALETGSFQLNEVANTLYKQRKSPTFFPVSGTFKSLVSQGEIELFSTKMKRELFNLYDTNYERTVYNGNLYDEIYVEVYDKEIRSMMNLRSQKIDNPNRLTEKDFIKSLMVILDEAKSYLSLIKKSTYESQSLLESLKS